MRLYPSLGVPQFTHRFVQPRVAHKHARERPLQRTPAVRLQAQKVQDKAAAEEKQRETERRSYKTLLDEEAMTSNRDVASKYANAEDFEDDFM